jgi:GDPmannose 4,6-dehydratase
MTRRALITGISGQDGSYLAEFLLAKGYEVHGILRSDLLLSPKALPQYLLLLRDEITFHAAPYGQPFDFEKLFAGIEFSECYHLGGPSTVDSDFLGGAEMFSAIFSTTRSMLDAIVSHRPACRLFFAGSSEMFGHVQDSPQDETTPFRPRSLYGFAKLAAYHALRQRRHKAGIFACTGILYNHESPRRAAGFLPRKVSLAAARIKLGLQKKLLVGNRDAVRDWGYAPDFVIATSRLHSVEQLIEQAFAQVGLDPQSYVEIDQRFYRPVEPVALCGNFKRLNEATGWRPRTAFHDVISKMVQHDLAEQASDVRPNVG